MAQLAMKELLERSLFESKSSALVARGSSAPSDRFEPVDRSGNVSSSFVDDRSLVPLKD